MVEWLDLGGGAGSGGGSKDGLSDFKDGWSTGVRQAFFCGRRLIRERYDEICIAKEVQPTTYFPAYRDGEFTTKHLDKAE